MRLLSSAWPSLTLLRVSAAEVDASSADLIWGGLLAAGAVYEIYALANGRSGDTLSERTRSWFRVRTRAGAVVFGVAWCTFAAWFFVHILL